MLLALRLANPDVNAADALLATTVSAAVAKF
jgi:hypothetical protein